MSCSFSIHVHSIFLNPLAAVLIAVPALLAQDPANDPSTALSIDPGFPVVDTENPNNEEVAPDLNYVPPQEPYAPELPETGGNYEGPVGVTGIFNGNITTGCSYDPLSHSAHRVVDDIVVTGSIGKYPLKMTRYYNSRQQYYARAAIGLSPGWAHEYSWLLWAAGHKVVSPHGNVYDDFCGAPVGVSEGWENRTDAYNGIWRLADGGKVVFSGGWVTDIYDPYGQRTRIAYDATGLRVKVTEPGGRCLWFIYSNQDPDGTKLLTWVQAYDVDGSPGTPTHPTGRVIDWVNYTYDLVSPGVQGRDKKMLTGVNYSNGTSASYEYRTDNVTESPTSHKMYPLLQKCIDVRYNGPMRTIRYEYQNSGPHGAIINEKHPGIGAVSAIAPGLPVGGYADNFTETRGDGPTRAFNYTDIYPCRGNECGPCSDEGINGPNQQMLLSYTDFQGRTTHIGYDPDTWYITSVRDANNHMTSYTRGPAPPNGIGQITRITHPDTTHIDYTYYNEGTGHIGGHYIYTVTDERQNQTIHNRDANYRVASIDYKDNQNQVLAHEEFVYNGFGQVTRHKLKNGNYVHYQYDGRGLLIYKWNPTVNATAQQGDPKTTYSYWTSPVWADRIYQETMPANVSNQVAYERYEYDRNAAGNAVAGRGLVTKKTHADGKCQKVGYNQFGNKMWEDNELFQRTNYAYDNYNRLLTVRDPLNHIAKYDYSPTQNNTTQCYRHTTNSAYWRTTAAGIVTKNLYDPNFRKTASTAGYGTASAATTEFDYDNVGNLTWMTDPMTRKTRNIYDNRNRKSSATEAHGTNVAATTVWHYDGAGNINRIDRPDSIRQTKGYDGLNRMIWDSVPQSATVNLTTRYGYNPSGTVAWIKNPQQALNDPLAGTYFDYDASDQRIRMWYPGHNEKQEWAYDNAHNLKSRTTVSGKIQSFTYDNRNRKTGMSWSNGADSASYSYDDVGRLRTATNPNSTVTRAYDAAGHLTQDQQSVSGLGAKNVTYPLYDSDGRVKQLQLAGICDYTFGYDALGRFETISPTGGGVGFRYQYDGASNVTHRYTYPSGNVTLDQRTPRDSLNRMSGRWIYKNGTTPLAAQSYIYDRGNRMTEVDWGGVSDLFGYYWNGELYWCEYGVQTDTPIQEGQDPDLDTTDNVDPWIAYQPPETVEPEPTPPPDGPPAGPMQPDTGQFARGVAYYLDKAGNRTGVYDTVIGTTVSYTPNDLNLYTGSAGGAPITNGSEHEVGTYNGVTYSYINDEHLKQASAGTNNYYLYYDALGRCVKRKFNNVITYYIYDGEKPILEYNGGGALYARNIHGKGIDEILARLDVTVNGAQWFYYGEDHEGSVSHLINATGDLIESYQYDAFGAITKMWDGNGRIDHTALNNRFLFTGREYAASYLGTYVPAFSFYEYRARAYNPTLGRFMSEDPKLFDAGDYNFFRYCYNDPLDLTDPVGLEVGFGESLIPVWGSGHMAYDAFNQGHYGMAAFHTAMAVTDLSGAKALGSIAGKAALKGLAKMGAERAAVRAAEKAAAEKEGGLVIGKLKDLRGAEGWRKGDYTLNLPDRGSVKENWKQNSSLLRQEERTGKPIRDMSTDANGNLRDNFGFAQGERNVLDNRGRTLDKNSRSWTKPPDSTAIEERAIQQSAEKAAAKLGSAEHGLSPKPQ